MSHRPHRFLGLDDDLASYDRASFAILPIPYDATTSYAPGARFGPSAVLTASAHLEDFDEELSRTFHDAGIATLEPVHVSVDGPKATHELIHKAARRVVRDGKFLIGLGGDHSVTSALVRAVRSRYRKLSILHIDAHSDLRDSYEGSRYSHASVMRRVFDDIGVEALVPVGIRALSQPEHRYMKRVGIRPIMAREVHHDPDWLERAVDALGSDVYVSLDIDGFDPAYAPGTGTPEPGGLDWYQVTALLRAVSERRRLVGADVVEVAPIPGQSVTEFLAARLIFKIVAYATRATKRSHR